MNKKRKLSLWLYVFVFMMVGVGLNIHEIKADNSNLAVEKLQQSDREDNPIFDNEIQKRLIVLTKMDGFYKNLRGLKTITNAGTDTYILEFNSSVATNIAYYKLKFSKDIELVSKDMLLENTSNSEEVQLKNEKNEAVEGEVNVELQSYLRKEPTDKNQVVVAVLDTGISNDFEHQERILKLGSNYSSDRKFNDCTDINGHGTQMTNLILENTFSNVKILPIKVLNNEGKGTVLGLYLGIREAIENNVDVINISASTTAQNKNAKDLLKSILEEAYKKNIVVVASSGNHGNNVKYYLPASYEKVITVASVTEDLTHSSFSNYGDAIDYAMIGEEVASEGCKEKVNGTSASAARMTSIVAQLKAVDKERTVDDIQNILNKYAINVGLDEKYVGNGVISYNAIEIKQSDINEYKDIVAELDITDYENWKELSGEKFDDILFSSNAVNIAIFIQGLSEEDYEYALALSPYYLHSDYTVYEENGIVKTYLCHEYFKNYNLDDVDMNAYKSTTGYSYFTISGDGRSTSVKIDMSINSKYGSSSQHKITWSTSGTNAHNVSFTFHDVAIDTNGEWDTCAYWASFTVPENYSHTMTYPRDHLWNGSYCFWNNEYGAILGFYFAYGISSDPHPTFGHHCTFANTLTLNSKTVYYANTNGVDTSYQHTNSNVQPGYLGLAYWVDSGNFVTETLRPSDVSINLYACSTLGFARTGYHVDTGDEWKLMGTSYTFSSEPVSDKSKLNAIWAQDSAVMIPNWKINTYTVAYSGNGATGGSTANTSHTYNSAANLRANGYTRTGYTFTGWNTKANGTGAKYSNQQSVSNLTLTHGATVTLYAQWKANTYTITYHKNGATGGSTSNTSHTYNSASSLRVNGYTRTGYTFTGWNTKADGTGTHYNNQQSVSNLTTANGTTITLYAQWSPNEYTITYDSNGGSTPNSTRTYCYNDNVDLAPIAEKTGKIFIGWSTDPNAKTAMDSYTMPDCATSTNTEYKSDWEVTLYAVYTIPISDVANHTYPDYEKIKADEVYFRVWEIDSEGNANEKNVRVYPLEFIRDTLTMKYRYVLPTTDISDFVRGMADYGYEILAYDNAENSASIYKSDPPPPPLKKYWQTIKHYLYDQYLQTWVKFHETSEKVLEGMTYTPAYTTPPAGYQASNIDGEYIVREEQTSNAYYVPIDYTLSFDANEGTCDVTKKPITFNDYYGTMPTPSKEGHEFIGWYTEKEGGTEVKSSHKYLTAADTTVYAHWKVNSNQVVYDYWTNGGTGADKVSEVLEYGQPIDLSIKAYKDGWEFVGWNTDSTATSSLPSMTMPDHSVTLYAIYKKDITLTIVEQTEEGQVTRSKKKTIYNTDKEAGFRMKKENEWTGWTFLGWTDGTLATDSPITGVGNEYRLSENGTVYGVYTSAVTVSYDTNGSSMVIEEQTKDCYYNASGDALYPEYVIAEEPVLSQHSFVEWRDETGNVYVPGETIIFSQNTRLTAKWNKHPEIEAYNRYFTLEQAQNGEITEGELLKKVIGTDFEDGTLINGVDVIVKDYNANDFTSLEADKEIIITYQATDSFGNVVTKTIMVNVTDTSMRKSTQKRYLRFISEEFFADADGELISADLGGVEETSVWRQDSNYAGLLQNTLSNKKSNVETKTLSAFGGQWEVEVAGSGVRNKKEETWTFTREDINEMKNYTKTHGHVLNAMDEFWELFDKCRHEE